MTYGLVHTKDMFVITQEWEICTQHVMDEYLVIMYQLPNFAYYSYLYLRSVVDAYSMLRWFVLYTKCMITVMGLVHRNEFVVITWNYKMLV